MTNEILDSIYDFRNLYILCLLIVFLIVYIVVFIILSKKLKIAFPYYYNEHKKRLHILFGIMVFSLITQAIFRIVTNSKGS